MELAIASDLRIAAAPKSFLNAVRDRLTLRNPAYDEALRAGRSVYLIPPVLHLYHETDTGLSVPRGFIEQLLKMARSDGLTCEIDNGCRTLPEVDFSFTGVLKPFQKDALTVMSRHPFGTLSAHPGSGKTVMALALIAEKQQPTLVIVHRKELLLQWMDRSETFLGIPKERIGVIGDGENRIGTEITVGIINSIYPIAGEIKRHFGHLVVDECHRIPSRTFTDAVSAFDCQHMLGLTATPFRRDGLSELIFWHIGKLRHVVDTKALQASGDVLKADVVFRRTIFTTWRDPTYAYTRVLTDLTKDHNRNAMIVEDVVDEANNGGGICLVLSDRKTHCESLAAMLSAKGVTADILTGKVSNGARKAIVERLNAGTVKVLIATGQLIGEGFDCSGLSTLFLVTPIRHRGRLIQYLGRILRPALGKLQPKVYDYVDERVGVLKAAAEARRQVYQNEQMEA